MIKQQGLTLIEVLIAMAILAIALTAILKASSADITDTKLIQDKTLASLVAYNALTKIQLGLEKPPFLPYFLNKSATQAQQTFYWRAAVAKNSIKNSVTLTLIVSDSPTGKVLFTLKTGMESPT